MTAAGMASPASPRLPYTMEMLGRDVLAIMDGLVSKKRIGAVCPWAAWLGSRRQRAQRFDKLVLCNTAELLRRQKRLG